MIRSNYALKRWLIREILDKDIGRKPPAMASALHSTPPRDSKYRAWIRSLPCAVCGTNFCIESAHIGPHALAQKASDYTCIPLCPEHHRLGNDALDKIGRHEFEERFVLNIEELIQALNTQWRERR
jgi:hypothetical protein